MNERDFFYYVCQMRSAQRHYIQTRDQRTLRAACKLERIVDDCINHLRPKYE